MTNFDTFFCWMFPEDVRRLRASGKPSDGTRAWIESGKVIPSGSYLSEQVSFHLPV
jgi:hypothetical protein